MIKRKNHNIVINREKDGYKYMVIENSLCPCGYIGIPKDLFFTKLRDKDLRNVIDCHGGITFETYGTKEDPIWIDGYYWIGWDYAHYNDYITYPTVTKELDDLNKEMNQGKQKWDCNLIAIECVNVIEQLKELVKV